MFKAITNITFNPFPETLHEMDLMAENRVGTEWLLQIFFTYQIGEGVKHGELPQFRAYIENQRGHAQIANLLENLDASNYTNAE